MRFEPSLIQRLEQSKWWELRVEMLKVLVSRFPDVFFNPEIVTAESFSVFLQEREKLEKAP